MQAFFNVAPVGKLGPSVRGDGLDKLGWESGEDRNNDIFHHFGSAVWYLNGNVVPCHSLCQGGEAGFAFSLAAHNSIRFPMSGFLTTVYRLVPFTDGFPFAVFPSCFLGAVVLSLTPQDFEIPVYQVFFVDPAVDRSPAWHLQLTRRAGDLFWRPGRFQLLIDVVDHFL